MTVIAPYLPHLRLCVSGTVKSRTAARRSILSTASAKNFLRKDKKVEVVGRLESGHYTEPGGRKIYTKTVRVYEINFAETKAEEEARRQTRENEQVPPPAPENSSFMDIPEGDGEFPFR